MGSHDSIVRAVFVALVAGAIVSAEDAQLLEAVQYAVCIRADVACTAYRAHRGTVLPLEYKSRYGVRADRMPDRGSAGTVGEPRRMRQS